jgi:hypothetical protein
MKKLLIIFTLSVFFTQLAYSQDLIVTAKGDSINCKITKERNDFIYFTFLKDQEIRETLLQRSEIKTFKKEYFQQSEIPTNYKSKSIRQDYSKFRIGINGGYSYRFARINESGSSEIDNYMKKLKSGNQFSVDACFFLSESLGLGIKYSQHNSKANYGTVYLDFNRDGIVDTGQMNDDITISFFGPQITTQIPSKNKTNTWVSSFAIGYLSYNDAGNMVVPITLKGSTIGLVGDIGYQVGISKNLAIAVSLSYTLGVLTQFESTTGGYTNTIKLDKENYENLGRLDFSVGLIFHK